MATSVICAEDRSAEPTFLVGVLGDSISAGTPLWDPDPAVRAAIAVPDKQSCWPYWAAQANPQVEFLVSAVDGQRTDEIVRRLGLLGDGIQALVVQGGINDIVQGRSPLQAAAGIRQLLSEALTLGVPVGMPEILPWNVGFPDHDAPIRELNDLLHRMAEELDVTVFPFFGVLEDPSQPGRMRADWTIDGSHPSVAGHRRLGELAFRVPPDWLR